MTTTILRIDASARTEGSITRDLTDQVVARLSPGHVVTRDLARNPVPQLDAEWVGANFTPKDARTPAQADALSLSDALVAEIAAADTLVIGVPIYNFGVPAALKAWVDHVARAGVTFQYSETGPKGLMTGKRAVLVAASGGTAAGSDIDFATGYMRHVLGFIGITDVVMVSADQMARDPETALRQAKSHIDAIAA